MYAVRVEEEACTQNGMTKAEPNVFTYFALSDTWGMIKSSRIPPLNQRPSSEHLHAKQWNEW